MSRVTRYSEAVVYRVTRYSKAIVYQVTRYLEARDDRVTRYSEDIVYRVTRYSKTRHYRVTRYSEERGVTELPLTRRQGQTSRRVTCNSEAINLPSYDQLGSVYRVVTTRKHVPSGSNSERKVL